MIFYTSIYFYILLYSYNLKCSFFSKQNYAYTTLKKHLVKLHLRICFIIVPVLEKILQNKYLTEKSILIMKKNY